MRSNTTFSRRFVKVIIALGLWMIIQACRQSWHEKIHEEKTSTKHVAILRKPHHADIDDSKHIDFKEGTFLGVALSINNIGGGVSAGVLGINALLVGFLSAIISFITLFAGNYIGNYFVKRRIADKAGAIGGMLLILIGVKQVF
jgi:putative sporulation protein YtaF